MAAIGETSAQLALRDPDIRLMLSVRGDEPGAFEELVGRYQHRLERRAGSWRIVEHVFFVDLVGDLSQHLLIDLDATRQS